MFGKITKSTLRSGACLVAIFLAWHFVVVALEHHRYAVCVYHGSLFNSFFMSLFYRKSWYCNRLDSWIIAADGYMTSAWDVLVHFIGKSLVN